MAKFHGTKFLVFANFERLVFSGMAIFSQAAFTKGVSFERTTFLDFADFSATAFSGYALFGNFLITAQFTSSKFSAIAWFPVSKFSGSALFQDAQFLGHACFAGANFSDVMFDRAAFLETTRFDLASFSHIASFKGAAFSADALFEGTTFRHTAHFDQAKFLMNADFLGIKAERAFDLTGAVFAQLPSFLQAHFQEGPDLDDVKFPLPLLWQRGKEELIARYRAIRRMAIQGGDDEREHMAFKGEIRSKRGTEHRWYHAAFWYGLTYDALSDFGRSMSRPSLVWLLSICIFSLFYLANSGKLGSTFTDCAEAGARHYESALVISWKNAQPFISDARAEEVARRCLYGAAAYGGIAIQSLQRIWSTVLIFLFLLAVRNEFKIK